MVGAETNVLEMREKQREEKKKLIEKIKKENLNVMPYVYKNTIIKQDPFTAYKRELEMQKKNPNKELSPSPSIPKELIKAMRQKKSIQLAVKPKPFKRASPKAKNEDFKFFTVKNKAEENENTKLGQSL